MCPSCHKLNDIHKFCVYCGKELPIDIDEIKLMNDNPEPYCINCGRPVEKDKTKCECGYEFADIKCPKCNAKNAYANRFCTSCGKKLWTSDVNHYKYPKRLFEHHFLNETLPYELRNTSLYKRAQKGIGKNPLEGIVHNSIEDFQSEILKADNNLNEVCSRWKVVSPDYCINCLSIIKKDEYSCPNCGFGHLGDKKRVELLKSDNYVEPVFDDVELKWISKRNGLYLGSLAPAVGESQLEYRERLKWEFAENNNLKASIINAIGRKRKEEERKRLEEELRRQYEERKKQEEEYIRQFGGGYCGPSCVYYYEEFLDSRGGIVGYFDSEGYVEYYCSLGHFVSHGSFCKDYK